MTEQEALDHYKTPMAGTGNGCKVLSRRGERSDAAERIVRALRDDALSLVGKANQILTELSIMRKQATK